MRIIKIIAALLFVLILAYFLGPKSSFEAVDSNIPELNLELQDLDKYLDAKLSKVENLKPGNQHELVFYDSLKRTEYVLIYLHGFSASPKEGFPLHASFAKRYGMNFYAPLLVGHGRGTKESFLNLTPKEYLTDAAEAMAIGKLLGKKIILMSCSTGTTLGTYLDAENPGLVDAHIMYSPNFDLADSNSKLLTKPWGLPLAKMISGSDYHSFKMPPTSKPFWTTEYRIEGLVALRDLLNQTMTSFTFKKIKTPFMVAYYYEDETHQDDVISVAAIENFYNECSTAESEKLLLPLKNPKKHVVNCGIEASINIDGVRNATYEFAEDVLKLEPIVILEPSLAE